MVNERRVIDSRFDRAGNLAGDWARALDGILGERYSGLPLYRWDDPSRATEASADGSITLNVRTADLMSHLGGNQYDAHYPSDIVRPDPQAVRNAVIDFGNAYVDKVLPRDPTLDFAPEALDTGIRANLVSTERILDPQRMEQMAPGIGRLVDPEPYPLFQGAASELTSRLGQRLGMKPDELDKLLRRTDPAQRFDVLADQLIEHDPLQRRLPDGSARKPPADHTAQLKTELAHEFRLAFDRCDVASLDDGRNTRETGQNLVAQGCANAFEQVGRFRDEIHTNQRGYAEVADLVAAVQSGLSQGRATPSLGRDAGAMALQLKVKTDYWSGELRESTAPPAAGVVGYAGTDRSLTFDRAKVIDVLATADRTAPPTPEVREAVGIVASHAAQLCNPEAPGSVPDNAADRAFDEQLRQDFVRQHEGELFAALGFSEPQLGGEPQHSAVAEVTATLTQTAGQHAGLEPHEVTSRLLTTPPAERFDKAAALALANTDGLPTGTATRALADDLHGIVGTAAEADAKGAGKLHAWSLKTSGESLSGKTVASVDKARKPFSGKGAADDVTRRQFAAATSGQTPLRPGQAVGQTSTDARTHQPDNGNSRNGLGGRG
ncbi:hypothetical protein ACWGID_32495 [Kribbella sp. NPDC054772]